MQWSAYPGNTCHTPALPLPSPPPPCWLVKWNLCACSCLLDLPNTSLLCRCFRLWIARHGSRRRRCRLRICLFSRLISGWLLMYVCVCLSVCACIIHEIQLQPSEVDDDDDDNGAPGSSRQHKKKPLCLWKKAASRLQLTTTATTTTQCCATCCRVASAKKQYVYGKSSKTFVAFCLSFDGVQIEIEFRLKPASYPIVCLPLSPLFLLPSLTRHFQHTALLQQTTYKSARQKANNKSQGRKRAWNIFAT